MIEKKPVPISSDHFALSIFTSQDGLSDWNEDVGVEMII
jgi:hypothetical protein